ncbi:MULTISPECIES: SsgA family sporulation/cell division regulator [Streptomyces]|uniref:SsgA family sporulation/cell division regulator n=1 Tax=Streptomyces edwardsiae TaxID=3075527 RepID=A0ABU2PR59_9ACTN|nr:SsgA family sporulation/cell division regulator [Streptomyces sp. DSM 41636]MDT0394173.1 SsgA family sporulation/cell division regulator [Streptomyces sp. DSM 41636]
MSGRSSETRRDPVTCRTPVRLVRERAHLSVVTDLRYDRADPYAVTILFNADAGPGMAVEWRFGRELLLAGREGLSGLGDVRIWPSRVRGYDLVFISLRAGTEMDVVAVPAAVIDVFVQRTLEAVPVGEEERFLDVERDMGSLLDDF